MPSSQTGRSRYGRWLQWLAAAIGVVVIAYSGGWYWLSGRLTASVKDAMAAAGENGQTVTCENPRARGYPFRIGLFCDTLDVRNPAQGVTFSAGALRSAAQIYEPAKIVGELDGPALIEAPGLNPLKLDWELLHASFVHDLGKPRRISVETKNISAGTREAGDLTVPLGKAENAQVHLRVEGEALDLALSADGVVSAVGKDAAPPPATLAFEATIDKGAALLLGPPSDPEHPLRGQTINLRKLALSYPARDASIDLNGTLTISNAGMADGTLTAVLFNPDAIGAALQGSLPPAAPDLQPFFASLSSSGVNGQPVTFTIRESRIYAGLFPIGQLPPF